jgi:hypothetical protein
MVATMSPTGHTDDQGKAESREQTPRELAPYGSREEQSRFVRATEIQAVRTPTPLESAALLAASAATGIVLAGVVLIVIADAVKSRPRGQHMAVDHDRGSSRGAGAVTLTLTHLSRRRAEDLLSVVAPWTMNSRLERIEKKRDELLEPEAGQAQATLARLW